MKTFVTGLAAALVLVGTGVAAEQKDTLTLTANLKARFEVPKPIGVPAAATGRFTGRVVEQENDRARLTWRLAFSRLSGRALAAHVHIGRSGKAGGVMVGLCGPCRKGQRGAATITHAQLRMIRAGRTYVNIHTAKNQAGEIRGQVKATEVASSSSSGSSPPPPPSTTPEPPPPPPPYP